ncbi:DUF4231 domain-containing protein [Petralouisia muris]|uniref:DUF4231 domain-containing protein n=1 Tax=Petralouisia muris TaxID=3032872 RepID=A0AC61RQI3_9FIRM|nr:DUF4231 domain-containing protein [Petralouisia muris]TGY91158.1 DUF4231 domain-containing protein [Petralouisia muris]
MRHQKFGWGAYKSQNKIPKTEKEFVLRLLDMIQEDAIRFRLSNLLIWYICKAGSQKRMYYILNITAIFANLLILIVNTVHNDIPCPVSLITTVLAAVASGALSINGLGHYKDNWMRYRTSAEVLKERISQYVIKREECKKRNQESGNDCIQFCKIKNYGEYGCPLTEELMNQVNEYVTKEISEWKQCNEKEADAMKKNANKVQK